MGSHRWDWCSLMVGGFLLLCLGGSLPDSLGMVVGLFVEGDLSVVFSFYIVLVVLSKTCLARTIMFLVFLM